MRFPGRTSTSVASFLAVSGTVVGGAAVLRSAPVDASEVNVVCAQPVEADDRLRVNLAVLEEVLAGLGPQEGAGADGADPLARDGCAGDDRTGVDYAPPAQMSLRLKNLEAGPVAEIETKQVQDDIDRVVEGTVDVVRDTRDQVIDDTHGTLDGTGAQVSEGVDQTLSDTYDRLPEDVTRALDSLSESIARETAKLTPEG